MAVLVVSRRHLFVRLETRGSRPSKARLETGQWRASGPALSRRRQLNTKATWAFAIATSTQKQKKFQDDTS